MISVIISTYRKHYLDNLIKNIDETINVQYEIIAIENNARLSVAECYNQGINRAKYNILCFIHDDIIIKTINWGITLQNIFLADPLIKLIGIAGVKHKSVAPSFMWDIDKSLQIANIIHTADGSNGKLTFTGWDDIENTYQKVMMVDGVFMALDKTTGLRFNEAITGFHCYDMCMSMECLIHGYKVVVTRNILLEHFSLGKIDKSWITPTHTFHRLYRKSLQDFSMGGIDNNEELLNLKRFSLFVLEDGFIKISLYWWRKIFIKQPLSVFQNLYIQHFLSALKNND
jgi:hypothetical protein